MADIETRADCERLVRAFYERALVDPVIGWLFTDVAKLDLEEHVPRITDFWPEPYEPPPGRSHLVERF